MSNDAEEQVELRLLADPAFNEQFDIVVDEIAAFYVSGKFEGAEREQVENYFLKSPERRSKVKFMCELVRQIDEARENSGTVQEEPVKKKPGFFESVRAFLRNQPPALRVATSVAILVIAIGLWFWLRSINSPPTYLSLELTVASADRGVGSEIKKVRLTPGTDELRITLHLAAAATQQKRYRAELRGEQVSLPQLAILEQTSGSLLVAVPTNKLTRGTYFIQLAAINAAGTEQPLRGDYLFAVE